MNIINTKTQTWIFGSCPISIPSETIQESFVSLICFLVLFFTADFENHIVYLKKIL